MADLYWGFQQSYGHRTLPSKWTTTNGFTMYTESPLSKIAFWPKPSFGPRLPIMDESKYLERAQNGATCQSVYGLHREMTWENALRRTFAPAKPSLYRKPLNPFHPERSQPRYHTPRAHVAPLENPVDARSRSGAGSVVSSALSRSGKPGSVASKSTRPTSTVRSRPSRQGSQKWLLRRLERPCGRVWCWRKLAHLWRYFFCYNSHFIIFRMRFEGGRCASQFARMGVARV